MNPSPKTRNKHIIRGKQLRHNSGIEAKYYRTLVAMIDKMTAQYEKQILAFFKKPVAKEYFYTMDESVAAQAKILTNQLQKKIESLAARLAKPVAETFVNESDKWSALSIENSFKMTNTDLTLNPDVLTGELNEILSASVTANVNLIKSIAQQYLTQVNGAVMRSITGTTGMSELVPFLQKQKGITIRRARMIAHDQTYKVYSALNRHRLESNGVKKFEWRHLTGSKHPRKLHEELNGQIFSFDDPPVIDKKTGQRGLPGDLINCRCEMRAIISFE